MTQAFLPTMLSLKVNFTENILDVYKTLQNKETGPNSASLDRVQYGCFIVTSSKRTRTGNKCWAIQGLASYLPSPIPSYNEPTLRQKLEKNVEHQLTNFIIFNIF